MAPAARISCINFGARSVGVRRNRSSRFAFCRVHVREGLNCVQLWVRVPPRPLFCAKLV